MPIVLTVNSFTGKSLQCFAWSPSLIKPRIGILGLSVSEVIFKDLESCCPVTIAALF